MLPIARGSGLQPPAGRSPFSWPTAGRSDTDRNAKASERLLPIRFAYAGRQLVNGVQLADGPTLGTNRPPGRLERLIGRRRVSKEGIGGQRFDARELALLEKLDALTKPRAVVSLVDTGPTPLDRLKAPLIRPRSPHGVTGAIPLRSWLRGAAGRSIKGQPVLPFGGQQVPLPGTPPRTEPPIADPGPKPPAAPLPPSPPRLDPQVGVPVGGGGAPLPISLGMSFAGGAGGGGAGLVQLSASEGEAPAPNLFVIAAGIVAVLALWKFAR